MQEIIIVGYGKMAHAIALGLHNKFALEIAGRDERKINNFILENNLTGTKAKKIDKDFDIKDKIIILCIKPYALESFNYNNEAKALYSILAGVNIDRLKKFIKAKSYCRVMPNVASTIGKGVSAIYLEDRSLRRDTEEIFNSLGSCVFLEKEELINSAGALSGSGPAYLAIIAEALIDAGIREGLNLDVATELTRGLFYGFGELLLNSSPSGIKLSVTSPGGTTAEAVAILEQRAIRGALIDAVHKANEKASNI